MSPSQEISLGFSGIGKLLREGRVAVPRFQRPYAWEEAQVGDLLDDLADAIAKRSPEYFLGTVVLTSPESGTPEVIDGQQRLATAVILLCAIRDFLVSVNDIPRADDIEREYVATRDLRSQERVPRLTLGGTDHSFFDRTIIARPDATTRDDVAERESEKKLRTARDRVSRHIRAISQSSGANVVARLLDWVEYVADKARVIVLRVPDATNAYRVFETLNDRGLELSVADLLKNHILSLAGPRESEAHASWISMAAALEPLSEDEVLIGFLRHYWSSRFGLTRAKYLFDQIKQRVNSRQAAVDLAADLMSAATKYAALVETSPERWGEYGPTAQGHMATLNLFRMTQLRPLLLTLVEQLSVSEVRKSLRYLVSVAVRIVVVGSRSGALEEAYSNAAVRVHRGEITTARQLSGELEHLVPQDRDFEAAFAIATVSRDPIARYYLRALERAKSGESHPEWVPNSNQEEVTLEHVLPERPDQGWGHLDNDSAKALWKRLGNMALLTAPANEKVGNRPFADKRPALRESTFALTSEIAGVERWTANTIEDRQQRLARLAVVTWPRNV